MAAKNNSKTPIKSSKKTRSPRLVTKASQVLQKQLTTPKEQTPIDNQLDIPDPPVVGIGASAGGLNAFKNFLTAMPANSGIAFVLVPHLDPKHDSMMVELLARHTKMPIVEATDGMNVEANHVYVIPPNKYMTISQGVLRLTGPVERSGPQTSIDLFLRSLAQDKQEKAICIILSGTGAHGALGLKAVKASAGMAMVQEPSTAEYARMPQSAIATGLADFVLPVEKMPEELTKYVQHLNSSVGSSDGKKPESPDQLNDILAILRLHTKYDFRCYRKRMLSRRIERRMSLNHFDQLAEYHEYLRKHPDEVKKLFRDLLISVTHFFRDPEAFHALEMEVLNPLIQSKQHDAPLRIWSVGCATGEEPYSLGILLLEQLTDAQKSCPIQIFATDVDEAALDMARQGIYPESISTDVSAERLARYFIRVNEVSYQVNKQLRDLVVYARQNLITDAPFSKIDLIVCRNVLIYLEPEIQKKVMSIFHFSLNQGGYLFLGPSETIGRHVDLFEPVSKKWRIFRRIGPVRPERIEVPIAPAAKLPVSVKANPLHAPIKHGTFAELTHRLLLDQYAPAAVLINRKYEILYFFGATDRYLSVPSGEPTQDLMLLARDGLRTKLRSSIHKAIRENCPVTLADAHVKHNDGNQSVIVTIRPVQGLQGADGHLLITFQDSPQDYSSPRRPRKGQEESLVQQLEYELKATREDLQSTVEELESSNEELKVSNEEVMSMNEELQSSNEELETSKEELQSLNEELSTVNNQLQDKVADLEKTNNDMANLLSCSEVGILFLDNHNRIKRFTPPTKKLYNLISSDLERPLNDITPKFHDHTFQQSIDLVNRHLSSLEKQLKAQDGSFWNCRITPYRTLDNHIEGVVLTFTDISQVKKADEQAQRLAALLRDSNDAIVVHDFDGRIMLWNHGAELLTGYSENEAIHMNCQEMMPDQELEIVGSYWERLKKGQCLNTWQSKRKAKNGRMIDVHVTATLLFDDKGSAVAVAKTERDITNDKRIQEHLEHEVERRTHELRKSQEQLTAVLQTAADAIITIDSRGIIQTVNTATERLFGYAATEMLGRNVKMLMPFPYRQEHDGYLEHYAKTGLKKIIGIGREVMAQRKDGTTFPIDLAVSAVDHLGLFTGIIRDITKRKELEREIVEIASLEQHRIGQDLHDSVGQELTALNILAGDLTELLQADHSSRSPIAEKIKSGLGRTQTELRSVLRGLLPVAVDADGLMASLTDLAHRIHQEGKVKCSFDYSERVSISDNLTATHLYLIAQEAVHNAIKHAKANHVYIELKVNHSMALSIKDDGIGMPTQSSDMNGGLGLRIMQNRASIIGASLSIGPADPVGTLVTCTLARTNHETKAG